MQVFGPASSCTTPWMVGSGRPPFASAFTGPLRGCAGRRETRIMRGCRIGLMQSGMIADAGDWRSRDLAVLWHRARRCASIRTLCRWSRSSGGGRVVTRFRWPSLPRRGVRPVDQPAWPRRTAHRRGYRPPGAHAGTGDAGRVSRTGRRSSSRKAARHRPREGGSRAAQVFYADNGSAGVEGGAEDGVPLVPERRRPARTGSSPCTTGTTAKPSARALGRRHPAVLARVCRSRRSAVRASPDAYAALSGQSAAGAAETRPTRWRGCSTNTPARCAR